MAKTAAVVSRMMTVRMAVPFQPMPEKLPLDQLCRFTMLLSSANVTMKSVAAEQI